MLPKGILFDLDDTIISYNAAAEPTWLAVCREFAARYDLGDGAILYDAIHGVSRWYWSDVERHKIGRNNLNNARREIASLALRKFPVDEAVTRQMADAFSERREEAVHLIDRAIETLSHFQAQGVAMALVTNGESHKQRRKIERFGLEGFFRTILIEGEMGFGKPEAVVYRRALVELGLDVKDVWAVGDNLEWDVGGPQKLGIRGIWNDYARQGLPPSSPIIPDRIVHAIAELID